ncbi:MAG: CPBP family intramembrane metalloprotease [Gemmatimonadetes bacterium]|nr:CPBP family intramembrane metalloprotease [Gemmatimonadota bacterium]
MTAMERGRDMQAGSRWRAGWLVAAGGVGLAVFVLLYRQAFPQAAVTLEVTRPEAVERAREFLSHRGATLDGYRQAAQFGGDDDGLAFLQRTVGLEQASRWARERVPIWSWDVRWFKPAQKEEWRVGVGVDGRVVRFQHLIDEATPGADAPQDSALAQAERFLVERGWSVADFDRVESSSRKRDQRTDHHFTWEHRGTAVAWTGAGDTATGSGAVRLEVDVLGDAVGSYRHFLKVPETFERDVQRTMGVGQLLAIASLGLTFVLVLVALGLTIARHRHGDIRWQPAFRLAGLVFALALIQGVLSWPMARYAYSTELGWGTYIGMLVLILLLGTATYGLWVLFTATAGESLGREAFPRSLGGFMDAVMGRLDPAERARASFSGYAVGFAILGYLTIFYVIAQRYLGAWLPAEGPYSNIFNVYWPFLAPLTISLVAAVTEETTYRLFGISLIKRYARSTALALLVPAAIWAFGHSNYPVFPVYLRGIELTIGGVFFGLAFLQFGLLACIVAHFVIDAVQIGMPLLTSGNPAYVVSGLIVMGIALVPALLGWRLRTAGSQPERDRG